MKNEHLQIFVKMHENTICVPIYGTQIDRITVSKHVSRSIQNCSVVHFLMREQPQLPHAVYYSERMWAYPLGYSHVRAL